MGVGIVGGLGLIVIEIIFKKHQIRKNKKDSVAKTAVRKWKGNVEVRLLENISLTLKFIQRW